MGGERFTVSFFTGSLWAVAALVSVVACGPFLSGALMPRRVLAVALRFRRLIFVEGGL